MVRNELVQLESFALTSVVIDRVLAGVARPLRRGLPRGTLHFEDFVRAFASVVFFEVFFLVAFLMAMVDKGCASAIEYWFRCLDLGFVFFVFFLFSTNDTDADGVISPWELQPFYKEQNSRVIAFCGDDADSPGILFEDWLCQMLRFLWALAARSAGIFL